MQTRETPHPLIADITACMAANKAADVDRSARFFLDSINKRLRHHRKILSDPVLADLYAGENWAAPGIRDLIRESELHRGIRIPDLPRVTTKPVRLDPAIWGEVA